jgi:signal recognition particle receptor subunit beta
MKSGLVCCQVVVYSLRFRHHPSFYKSLVQLNHAKRELTIKIVYYGPGLSGKTTNLQVIHSRMEPSARGQLLTIPTHDDRTLFFDLLPVHFQSKSGIRIKVKLFTVPGQVIHNSTRRIVLQGSDAIAFVADSRRQATEENNLYWKNMRQNMHETGLDPEVVPAVIQFNKRDLPDAKTDEELERARASGKEPIIGAVATQGIGVLETLFAVLQAAYQNLDARSNFSRNLGIDEAEFLANIFNRIDTSSAQLPF